MRQLVIAALALAAGVAAAAMACANLNGLSGGGADASEADVESDIPEGGLPSQPGVIDCPSPTECPLSTSYCCTSKTDVSCVAASASCTTYALHCKEKADCPGSEICCARLLDAGVEYTCQRGCLPNAPQACRTNSECAGGQCELLPCRGTVLTEYCNAPAAPPLPCQ